MLGPEDISTDDMAQIMTEVLGRPVRCERQALDDFSSTLLGYGLSKEFVQGLVDMKRAKDEGLDAGARRTAQTATPTTFRQWCEQVLKPALLA